jgi:hypothetical protein
LPGAKFFERFLSQMIEPAGRDILFNLSVPRGREDFGKPVCQTTLVRLGKPGDSLLNFYYAAHAANLEDGSRFVIRGVAAEERLDPPMPRLRRDEGMLLCGGTRRSRIVFETERFSSETEVRGVGETMRGRMKFCVSSWKTQIAPPQPLRRQAPFQAKFADENPSCVAFFMLQNDLHGRDGRGQAGNGFCGRLRNIQQRQTEGKS